MDLKDKVAIITGAARGIGQAMAEVLLKNGAKVSLCDVLLETGRKTQRELEVKYGSGQVIFIKCDVTLDREFQGAFNVTLEKFGHIDILLNNAGIGDERNWSQMVDTNLKGVIRGMNLAFKYMGRHVGRTDGVIINMGSNCGLFTGPPCFAPVYYSTKHAVVALSRCYSLPCYYDLHGLKVMCLCPAGTNTDLLPVMKDSTPAPEEYKNIGSFSKLMTPEYVAESMLQLLRNGDNGAVWLIKEGKPPLPIPPATIDLS